MAEAERISLTELVSNIPEETLEEWRRMAIDQYSKPDPHARTYNPRFPLADQSYAAQEDFYYKLQCMKAEQEYFDLLEKKKKRECL